MFKFIKMKCFLCNNKNNVLHFNKTSFKKCLLMLLFRRKKKYKYHDILLTVKSTEDFGYHSECLKKVTVLKQKDKQEFDDFCKTQTVPSLPLDLDEQSTSAMSCDLEEPSTSTSYDLPATISIDDQSSTTALYKQPSSDTPPQQVISSTIKKSACLFCDHIEKKVGKRRTYVTFPQSQATVEAIKVIAEKSNESKLLAKLKGHQSVAYHSNCLSFYQMSWKRQNEERPEPRYWHKNRKLHQLAFNAILEIINTEIIEKNGVMYLTDLLSQYKALLLEFGEGQVRAEDFQDYRVENLESKIITAFGDRLTVELSVGVPKRKLQRKWKTLRDGFNRDLAYKRTKSRGKLGMRRKQYMYFKQLSFLLPLADARIKPEDLKMSDSSEENEKETPAQTKPKIVIKRKRKLLSEKEDSDEESYAEQKSYEYKSRKQSRKHNTSQSNATLTHSSTEHDKEQSSPPLDFDVDKYFLLSLHRDFKNIPEEYKIDAKSDIIEVIRKYKQRDPIRYRTDTVIMEKAEQADSNIVEVQQVKYEYNSNEELISSSD